MQSLYRFWNIHIPDADLRWAESTGKPNDHESLLIIPAEYH